MVEVLKAGLYTTIQDCGRFGFQNLGVPASGAMDSYSAKLANLILANDENAAVIEITVSGPKLKFHSHTQIAITGAEMSPRLNGELIANNEPIIIQPDDVLSFGNLAQGCRAYIAVKNGFITDLVLNSRSMYYNITESEVLRKGDVIPISEYHSKPKIKSAKLKVSRLDVRQSEMSVFKGPEYNFLSKEERKLLVSTEFTVSSQSNRMAYLFNEVIKNNLQQMITSLVLPGTVQLTPKGQLIVLARDCQTTGGYPRVLQLTEMSMNVLFQKNSNDKVKLNIVDKSCKK